MNLFKIKWWIYQNQKFCFLNPLNFYFKARVDLGRQFWELINNELEAKTDQV